MPRFEQTLVVYSFSFGDVQELQVDSKIMDSMAQNIAMATPMAIRLQIFIQPVPPWTSI
jgi:hypothetical protein